MGFPTCKYRKNENGEIESEIFDSDEVPSGWSDSPADLANGGLTEASEKFIKPAMELLAKEIDVDLPINKSKKKRRKRGD